MSVFPSQDLLFACLGITAFRLLFLSEQSKVNYRMAFSKQPLLELVFDDDAGGIYPTIDKVEPRVKMFRSCNQEHSR